MIKIDLRLTTPAHPAMDMAAIAGAAMSGAGQMLTRYPQSEMWEITAVWSRARYSVRNALGQTMAKVQAVGRGANTLKVGQVVQVCYYNRDRRKPYIKTGMGWADWSTNIRLALWSQRDGTPGLTKFSVSNIVDPTAASAYVFSSVAATDSQFFGICIDTEDRLICPQFLRDAGNTFWETLRINFVNIVGADTIKDVVVSSPPSSVGGAVFINSDASAVVVTNSQDDLVFRLRGDLLEEVTLSGVAGMSVSNLNVSGNGLTAVLGGSQRLGVDVYTVDFYGSQTTTYSEISVDAAHRINAWNLNTDDTAISAVGLDISSLLGYSKQYVHPNTGNAKIPFAGDGITALVWVSGHKIIDYAAGAVAAMLNGWTYTAAHNSTQQRAMRTDLSREVKGVVAAFNTLTQALTWQSSITVTAVQPEDVGLLGPIETFFAGRTYAPGTIYNGRATHHGLSSGSGTGQPFCSGPVDDSVTFPDFELFVNAAIVPLPRPTSNELQPVDVGGNLRNLHVFAHWITASSGAISMDAGLRVDSLTGDIYFAYLQPKTYLTPASPEYAWAGNLVAFDFSGFTLQVYHLPGIANCYRRFLRKLSSAGALLAEAEIVQKYTASWWETESALGGTGGSTPVGGDSSVEVDLGDNVWGVYPCGRVVFVLLDYHDLGPNFYPATKLEIRDASDLSLLHTVELRFTEDVIGADIYSTVATDDPFYGDGSNTTFTLSYTPVSVTSITLDGAPETGYSISGQDIVFDFPPGLGVTILVFYERNDEIVFRSGERLYSVDGTTLELRCGKNTGAEWALIWVNQVERSAYPAASVAPRTVRVEMGSAPGDAPTVSSSTSVPDQSTSAVSAGKIFTTDTDGGLTKIRQTG